MATVFNPKVTWTVKNQFNAYNPQSKRCSLCLNEKFEILEDKENNLLIKKSEVISKCLHQQKYMLRIRVGYSSLYLIRLLGGCEAFFVTKFSYSRCLNITCTMQFTYMLKEIIYSQLYYTKVLNECKFQNK